MISLILQSIKGIEIYPTISLIIFFAFFVAIVVRVMFMKKSYLEKMKRLPLEKDKNSFKDGVKTHGQR